MQPRRPYYGITEVADALGQPRPLVTVWRRRRSWGMPVPDDELSSGPIWRGETIEPWIDVTRARLVVGEVEPSPPSPTLVRRVARRMLRLAALRLEEEQRPGLLVRASSELMDTRAEVAATADGPLRTTLMQMYDEMPDDEPPELAEIVALLLDLVPLLKDLEQPGEQPRRTSA